MHTQVLFELATETNSVPLPEFTERHGLRLPHEDDCLTAQAYHFASRQDADITNAPAVYSASLVRSAAPTQLSQPTATCFTAFSLGKRESPSRRTGADPAWQANIDDDVEPMALEQNMLEQRHNSDAQAAQAKEANSDLDAGVEWI